MAGGERLVKELASKHGDPEAIPGTHTEVDGEKPTSHMCPLTSTSEHACMLIYIHCIHASSGKNRDTSTAC